MRILHVASEHPPQQVFGLGRYVCDLSRELARQGHTVHVLTNSLRNRDQEVRDQGVFIHRVDFPPPPKPPEAGAPLAAFNLHLSQRAHALGRSGLGDPEVIVSHDWLTAIAGHRLARRWGVRHVWTVHDTVHGKRFGKVEDPEDKLTFRIESWAAKEADLVLVNSRAIGEEVAGIYGADKTRLKLLHCAIDPDRFVTTHSDVRVQAFREAFLKHDELLITYCGRLDLEKGIDTLVNAFAAVRQEFPRARLALAGRGGLQETIQDHVRRLGLGDSVRLLGYLEGEVLKHFYIVSDIHVCPSHYEPFGLVAAEAMAAGTPVVVSRTGGLVDIVSSPEVGRVVPPKDAGALARALLELATNRKLRKTLGRAGQRHVRKNFSWSQLAKRAAGFYSTRVA